MEFVVPLMLIGLAGIAIPILIHLFNRRTARTVDWGAYRFLETSMLKRRRRVLVEETLLLVTRCLIVALAALALARPFINPQSRVPWPVVLPLMLIAVVSVGSAITLWIHTRWRNWLLAVALVAILIASGAIALERQLELNRFGRGADRDVAIIIDSSASMALTIDGITNHQRVLAEIEADIRSADRGIAFGLILGSALPRSLSRAPLNDHRTLFAALEGLEPSTGTMDVPAALAAATAQLSQGINPAKQIIIYGDGQAAGWHPENETRWQVVKTLFSQLPSPPRIIWRTLELPPSLRNVAVEDIAPLKNIVGTDRETTFQVTIRNTGEQAVTPTRVVLELDGETRENKVIGQILPGATRIVEFSHRFSSPGAKILQAHVQADDDISLDDHATRVLQVLGTLNVLLVEGNPGMRFTDSTTGYLKTALRPELQAKTESENPEEARRFLVAPIVESTAEFARRTTFENFVVVVLADVPQLPESARDALAKFVARGGGLLITPGAHARADFYNRWTWHDETIVPLPLHTFKTERWTRRRPSIDPATFTGGLIRNLLSQNDLSRAVVGGWWQLSFEKTPERVEGFLTQGDAFLATRRIGRGTVAITAAPLDASLSNLPSLASYLPLVHEIIYGLANPTTAKLNMLPSASPTILLSAGGLHNNTSEGTSNASSDPVDTERMEWATAIQRIGASTNAIPAAFVQTADGLALQVKTSLEPGTYAAQPVKPLRESLTPFAVNEAGEIPFVIIADIAESELLTLTETDLTFIRRFIDLQTATRPDEVSTALQGKRFGREIWRMLAVAALILLLLELMLARWIAIQRNTGSEEKIEFGEATGGPDPFQNQLAQLRNPNTPRPGADPR